MGGEYGETPSLFHHSVEKKNYFLAKYGETSSLFHHSIEKSFYTLLFSMLNHDKIKKNHMYLESRFRTMIGYQYLFVHPLFFIRSVFP